MNKTKSEQPQFISEETGKPLRNENKEEKYSKYFRNVSHLEKIDIYRFLDLFNVTDHAIGHALKKLALAGVRTGEKSIREDLEEAQDTIKRKLEMMEEDDNFSSIELALMRLKT